MRRHPHHTPQTFAERRASIRRLTDELREVTRRLEAEAQAIDLSRDEALPRYVRGTVECVLRDLLDDAVETLAPLEWLDEGSASQREHEALDLLRRFGLEAS